MKIINKLLEYNILFLFILMYIGININTNFGHICTYIYTFLSILLLLIYSIYNYKFNKKELLYIIIFMICSIFSIYLNKPLNREIIAVINTIIYIFIFTKIKYNKKTIKKIGIYSTIFLILEILTTKNAITLYYDKLIDINPNFIAQLIFILLVISNYYLKNKSKLLLIIINLISLIAIYNCNCRNVLICVMLYLIIIFIVPKKIKNNSKIIKLSTTLIISIGILMPIIITYLYNNNYSIDINLFGKSFFSGREHLWTDIFKYYINPKNYILGVPRINYINHIVKINYTTSTLKNLHNNYLSMLTNFGLLTTILYYYYIIKKTNEYINKEDNSISWGIIIILLISSLETILYSVYTNFVFCIIYIFLEYEKSCKKTIQLSN